MCGDTSICLTGFQTFISFPNNVQRGDGYLTQEFWLVGFDCYCWIETGWLVSASQSSPVLFWAQQSGDGTEFATLATARYVGVVDAADGNSGRFYVVRQADRSFDVRIDTAEVAHRATTRNPMWDDREYGYVNMGMELVASSGSATGFTFFTGNRYWTAPRATAYVGAWAAADDSDDPPYGEWLLPPDEPADEGGVYFTQCCLPLYGAEAAGPNTDGAKVQNVDAAATEDAGRPEPPPPPDESLFDRPDTSLEGVPALDTGSTGQVLGFDPEALAAWMATASLGVPYEGEVTTSPKTVCPVTAAEADELLPEPTGLEPDRLLCVATAEGSFTISAPTRLGDPQPESLTADQAYVVVDAATGNLLVAGAFRRG
ncbi:hypothetical protein ACFWN7_12225 [Agromyces sp. NPDC058484]|uniref:hypothetical protein n=1 Tax=Agromyces sp. NPDC058484 TaxID=3346524 RepID=UPI003661E1EC